MSSKRAVAFFAVLGFLWISFAVAFHSRRQSSATNTPTSFAYHSPPPATCTPPRKYEDFDVLGPEVHSKLATETVSNPYGPPKVPTTGDWSRDSKFCLNVTDDAQGALAKKFKFVVCTHSSEDTVSRHWQQVGYWYDCNGLPFLAYAAYWASEYRTKNHQPLVLDVGGNIGSCTHVFHQLGMCPVTWEPAPRNWKLLYAAWRINGWQCGHLVTAGAAASAGKSVIHIIKSNRGGSFIGKHQSHNESFKNLDVYETYTVPLARIDSVVRHHVHFMKMDIQGFEAHALKGASRLLERYDIDMIFVEVAPLLMKNAGSDPMDTFRLLHRFGYILLNPSNGEKVLPENEPGMVQTMLAAYTGWGEMNVIAIAPRIFSRISIPKLLRGFNLTQDIDQWPSDLEAWKELARI